LRIDPGTNRVARTIALRKVGELGNADSTGWLAAGYRSLWVADHYRGTVSRIDPNTGMILATIQTPGFPFWIDIGHGSLWVSALRYP
jgi:hypothetical protein